MRTPARFHFIRPAGEPKPAAEAFRAWLLAEAAQAPAPPEPSDIAA